MQQIRVDIRHSVRSLRMDGRFTAVVVLTLSLGIGANAAVFNLVRSTLLNPLPYEEPDRLGVVWTEVPERGVREATSAYANIMDWRAQSRAFEDLATFDPTSLTLTGGDWPAQVSTARVSANLFSVLGVAPAVGRTFSVEEEERGARVVVLSHDLWVERFGADRDAIGRTIQIAGMPFEVVGVMPQEFGFPERETQLWLPQRLFTDWETASARRGTDAWRVIGRLRPGVSFPEARRDMGEIAARLERLYPAENAELGATVVPLYEQVTGHSYRVALWTLFGAVGLVLLIACGNAAHLTLARGMDRSAELALRRALGATTPRLLRYALTENMVIAGLAWVLAMGLAMGGLQLLLALAPPGLPRLDEVGIDGTIIVYAAAVSLAAGLLLGTVSALGHARGPLFGLLREAGALAQRGGGHSVRNALIVLQFALALVLVFGADLLIGSFLEARRVEPGFAPESVLMANLSVETPARRQVFYDQVLQEVPAIPGVSAAALIEDLFISGVPNAALTIDGRGGEAATTTQLRTDAIAGDLFRSLGVPLLEGRGFSSVDDAAAPPVAIVNETMARRFWPGESPVGARFRIGGPESPWIEVVGVAGDMRRQGPELDPIPQVLRPYAQAPSRSMNLLLRTELPPSAIVPAIRERIADIDRSVPLYQVRPVSEALDRYLVQRRFQAFLLGLFSAVAVLLAAVGVYGLIAYSVARRTRELGVRMALGASPRRLVIMVLRQGLILAAVGVLGGMVCAVWLSDLVSALLFKVSAFDLTSIVLTAAILLGAALSACYGPARRAAAADPMRALRIQ